MKIHTCDRFSCMKNYFDNLYIKAESLINELLQNFCKNCSNDKLGWCNIFNASESEKKDVTCYVRPQGDKLQFISPKGQFNQELSADAMGIIIMLAALNILLETVTQDSFFSKQYYALRSYAEIHEESEIILAAFFIIANDKGFSFI